MAKEGTQTRLLFKKRMFRWGIHVTAATGDVLAGVLVLLCCVFAKYTLFAEETRGYSGLLLNTPHCQEMTHLLSRSQWATVPKGCKLC